MDPLLQILDLLLSIGHDFVHTRSKHVFLFVEQPLELFLVLAFAQVPLLPLSFKLLTTLVDLGAEALLLLLQLAALITQIVPLFLNL